MSPGYCHSFQISYSVFILICSLKLPFEVYVAGVDSSGPAVELATANTVLNQLDPSSCTFVKNDITPFLKDAVAEGRSWDVVVLDPPKLAPNKKVFSGRDNFIKCC